MAMFGKYTTSNFTDCPCALPDGTPVLGETYADIDPANESQVRGVFRSISKRSGPCYNSQKFRLEGKDGTIYNFLDYIGTQYLAYDIDVLRRAIGAKRLSIYGVSYGTSVGGVYASVFPENVDLLLLDGNMLPFPDKMRFSTDIGSTVSRAASKLLYHCRVDKGSCNLKDPQAEYDAIISQARSVNGLTALTAAGTPFRLNVGLFTAYVDQKQLGAAATWGKAEQALAALSPRNSNETARSEMVATILSYFCNVGNSEWSPSNSDLTWYHYGSCINSASIAEGGDKSYMNHAGVLGVDLAGRFLESDALRNWKHAYTMYGDAGAGAFVGILAPLFDWPVIPSPPAPLGNPHVPALVVGNLYDPATSYVWSQDMKQKFPQGALMTWQGVGHSVTNNFLFDKSSAKCFDLMVKYLVTRELPINGHVCKDADLA